MGQGSPTAEGRPPLVLIKQRLSPTIADGSQSLTVKPNSHQTYSLNNRQYRPGSYREISLRPLDHRTYVRYDGVVSFGQRPDWSPPIRVGWNGGGRSGRSSFPGSDQLRGEDLSGCLVDELAGEVVVLRRLVDGLEVEWTRRIAHLEQSDVVALEGHTSMTAFLKDRCRMSSARAQRAVTLSHQLPTVPFVAKALEADDLSLDQALVFTHVPDHLS